MISEPLEWSFSHGTTILDAARILSMLVLPFTFTARDRNLGIFGPTDPPPPNLELHARVTRLETWYCTFVCEQGLKPTATSNACRAATPVKQCATDRSTESALRK